jgi:hypothetical protein
VQNDDIFDDRNSVWRPLYARIPDTRIQGKALGVQLCKAPKVGMQECFKNEATLCLSLCSKNVENSSDSKSSGQSLQHVLDVRIRVAPSAPTTTLLEDLFPSDKSCQGGATITTYVHLVATTHWPENNTCVDVFCNIPLALETVRAYGWPDAVFHHLLAHPLVSLPAAVALGAISVGMYRALYCALYEYALDVPKRRLLLTNVPVNRQQAFLVDLRPIGDDLPEAPASGWPAWARAQLHHKQPVRTLTVLSSR